MDDQIEKGIYNKYRGINYEIQIPTESMEWYRYYIYIKIPFIKDEQLKEDLWLESEDMSIVDSVPRKGYKLYECNFLQDLYFHGGITWYNKEIDTWDRPVIRIGCDYAHAQDLYREHSLESVRSDVKTTIDDFLNKVEYGKEYDYHEKTR